MTAQPITVNLPSELYEQLRIRAEHRQHSVAAEMLDLLAMVVPVADELPADLQAAITPLALLDEADLWRAARHRLPTDAAEQLENLHLKRQCEGLTVSEDQARVALVRQYERAMLVRAQATALLKARGHDVASLLTPI